MVEYTPPPANLDALNPIQRYMQKGSLDQQDWLRLGAIILAYFVLRPYLQKAAKWWFSDGKLAEGEKAQKEYQERRAKVGANSIRIGKKDADQIIEDFDESEDVVTSGSNVNDKGAVVNRKSKPQPVGKSMVEDELLDWKDEPARGTQDGDKGDVMEWLGKWDK